MKIVVVSPHPDDESLGAGGFILKQKLIGNKVYWINMTDADEQHGWSAEFIRKRRQQIESVSAFYDFDGVYNLKFLPSSLENIDKIAYALQMKKSEIFVEVEKYESI